ncbi:MAG: hypothetical protein ABI839_06850 [Verrucomicrobiota bacterium]
MRPRKQNLQTAARRRPRRLRSTSLARRAPVAQPLSVPTRWVKNVIALFLLPPCFILTRTFFTTFTQATLQEQLWAGAPFWFFSLGAILWLIAFAGLPRPMIIYVFGHELTHALWVWLMGGRVSKFSVSRDGGHIMTNRTNFWIALAPYFFPLYSVLAILIYGGASLFISVAPYGQLLFAIIGATWAFHFTFTCWMIPKNQTDLSDHGTFFSLVFIYLMNLALLSLLLILASPRITFSSFGQDLVANLDYFLGQTASWMNRFTRGMD